GVGDLSSPAVAWLDDMCRNSEALLRIYIENLATYDWIYKQLTEQMPHVLNDVEGEQALLDELWAWASA
ncbi:hypothetical protein D7X33_44010, partial [Butyricicoccus sp. 1XD8-22]